MRFTFWLCNSLDSFEGFLKKAGVHLVIWASRYKNKIDEELLKTLVAQWFPCTNIILTCYRELGISLWNVYLITRHLFMGISPSLYGRDE